VNRVGTFDRKVVALGGSHPMLVNIIAVSSLSFFVSELRHSYMGGIEDVVEATAQQIANTVKSGNPPEGLLRMMCTASVQNHIPVRELDPHDVASDLLRHDLSKLAVALDPIIGDNVLTPRMETLFAGLMVRAARTSNVAPGEPIIWYGLHLSADQVGHIGTPLCGVSTEIGQPFRIVGDDLGGPLPGTSPEKWLVLENLVEIISSVSAGSSEDPGLVLAASPL